ncbi:DUF3299 domain-containing protein [Vibrio breoganii]|uniref:DUF3299 domain-containing protein n=1 Tax=Vibrio breoganii TaxID=553239 RepID=A0AAP8MSM8_9VIBR|nr:DUF3299 domain-containing protein [Vibrio breoganii]OEF87825.1 hypothetical protein B003_14240 [Vibrio breoganii 1C10]PMH19119.1 hypothetical protein BCU74_06710 [Vibrio breoganii]PMJ46917.1 hypothetical protein BCU21_08840 [Vibrio breoganii]PMK56072.1 hypothetical protein BCT97_12380 [Vibrio breoganii]PMK59360.1 hypothetical protein BCT98_06235 [Vibrio breoganii]
MTLRKLSSLLFIFASFSTSSAEMIQWKDFIPPATETIELPALSKPQVSHLYNILNYRNTSQRRDMSDAESQQYQKDIDALRTSGYEADDLLKLRDEALAIERRRLSTVNMQLNLSNVSIPGFLVPLEMEGMLTTKFLLVPTAGACIHTPPPPANQTVIVELEKGFELQDLYKVIVVTGDIVTKQQDLPISFIDGTEVVSTGYSMSAVSVEYAAY